MLRITENKVDDFIIKAKIRKEHIKEKLLKKHEGIDGIVVAILLIVIAVGVGIFFRNTIMTTISTALSTVDTKITALFGGTAGTVS